MTNIKDGGTGVTDPAFGNYGAGHDSVTHALRRQVAANRNLAARLAQREEEIGNLVAALARRDAEADSAVAKAAAAEQRIALLKSTVSWRITMPLRMIHRGATWIRSRTGTAPNRTRESSSPVRADSRTNQQEPETPTEQSNETARQDTFFGEAVDLIKVTDLEGYSRDEPGGIAVIMPCIDTARALKAAQVLLSRAGVNCRLILANDNIHQGFVSTVNQVAARINMRYIVYLAEDAYPGRNWLRDAEAVLERTGKGLLGFNDGKWKGRIASFGMVRSEWAKSLYWDKAIFYPGYYAHKADNELTVIARALNTYVYEPNCTLVEYDLQKDYGGSNSKDDAVFETRLASGFDGLAPLEEVLKLANEYRY